MWHSSTNSICKHWLTPFDADDLEGLSSYHLWKPKSPPKENSPFKQTIQSQQHSSSPDRTRHLSQNHFIPPSIPNDRINKTYFNLRHWPRKNYRVFISQSFFFQNQPTQTELSKHFEIILKSTSQPWTTFFGNISSCLKSTLYCNSTSQCDCCKSFKKQKSYIIDTIFSDVLVPTPVTPHVRIPEYFTSDLSRHPTPNCRLYTPCWRYN